MPGRRIPPAAIVIVIAIAGLLWALLVYQTDGFVFEAGGLRISSRSPRMPLAIAGLAFLLAWAQVVHQRRDRLASGTPPEGRGRVLLLPFAAAVTFNVLLMSGPTPPLDENHCVFVVDVGARFFHYLNCDAPEFLALARNPELVLGPNEIRQSRPLSFVVPHLLAAPLRHFNLLTSSRPYEPFAPEFLGFITINLATLFAAIVLFTRIVERAGGAPGVEAVAGVTMLTINELTRPFLFNPHTQMFNVLVPLLALALSMTLIARRTPLRFGSAIGIGVTLGIGMLWYGSFAVAALCAAVVQAAVFRRPLLAVVLGLAALAPYAAWVGWLLVTIGHFHNHEATQFRQFVWMADCARAGTEGCAAMLATKAAELWRASWPVLAFPVACIAVLHAATRARGTAPAGPQGHAYRAGMAITLGVITLFVAAIGYYVWRLSWMLVPPLIVIITLQLQALRRTGPALDGWRGVAVCIAFIVAWIAVLFARQGPYS